MVMYGESRNSRPTLSNPAQKTVGKRAWERGEITLIRIDPIFVFRNLYSKEVNGNLLKIILEVRCANRILIPCRPFEFDFPASFGYIIATNRRQAVHISRILQ